MIKYKLNKTFALLKQLLHLLLMLFMILALVFSGFVIYGIHQAYGQFKMLAKARPIQEVIMDESINDTIKQKLILVQKIKQFAEDSLFLIKTKSYNTYVDLKQSAPLYTLTGSKPYSFEAKEWWYPILGNLSYKGFFDKRQAKREYQKLKWNNYDIEIFIPVAWSTLGWFNDPVTSGMLNRNTGELANTIIHELAHQFIFVKGNTNFNENIASFIGDKGALLFLKNNTDKYKNHLAEYQNQKQDENKFKELVLTYKSKLESLYFKFDKSYSDEKKKAEKRKLITEFVLQVPKLGLHETQKYFRLAIKSFYTGNAFFMSYERYDSQQSELEQVLATKFNNDLKSFIAHYKNEK